MSAWADDVTPTLARAATRNAIWERITAAVRGIEQADDVRQVLVCEPRGEIVVVGRDETYVALRVIS